MMRTDADPPRGESEPSLDREVQGDVQRGAIVNGLGLLGKVAGPAFLLVVTRLYGAEVFGVFVTASSLVEIAVALLTSGFRDAAVRYVARWAETDREKLYEALANAFGFSIGGAVLILLAAQALGAPAIRAAYDFGDALAPAVRVMALVLPLMAFERVVIAATQGLRIMKYDAIVEGGLKPVTLLVAAYLIHSVMPTVEGLVIAWVISRVLTGLVTLTVYGREFEWQPLGRALRRFRFNRELLGFALPQNLNMTLNRFLTGIDVLMLGALGASAAAVGVYGAGAGVVKELRQIKLAFSGALAPQIARLYERGDIDTLTRVYSSTARWTATLALPALLLVAALHADLLRIFYPDYDGTTAFMLWLLPIPYFITGFGLAGNVVVMTGHSRLNLFNSATVGVVNVGLNLLLIPRFGMAGAAAASALGALALAALEVTEASRYVGVPMRIREVYRPHVAGLAGLAVLVGVAVTWPFTALPLLHRIGIGLGSVAVYGLVLWALPGRAGPPATPETEGAET